MKPKKIGFFGKFGQQNWGNECSLQAFIWNTRKYHPEWEMYCVCTIPEDTSARYGIPAYPMRAISLTRKVLWGQNNPFMKFLRKVFYMIPKEVAHWIRAYMILKGSQALIFPGTGMLTDYDGRIYDICYEIFKWSIIAKLCRCKLMFVSIGAGPILHPVNRWFIKSALSMAAYRSYRNDYSRKYLEGIGFNTQNDPLYPDLAFSLPSNIMPERTNRDKKRPVIGVGVADQILGVIVCDRKGNLKQRRDVIYRQYIDNMCSFITWLLDNQYTVRILMGDTMYDSVPKEELKRQLKMKGYDYKNDNIIDEPITSFDELVSQLAQTDVVVSPRFHNIILAVMLNKPVISISYHEKFDSLMASLELGEYCAHTNNLKIEDLIELLSKLLANVEDITQHIKLKAEENRVGLETQYSIMFDKILDIKANNKTIGKEKIN